MAKETVKVCFIICCLLFLTYHAYVKLLVEHKQRLDYSATSIALGPKILVNADTLCIEQINKSACVLFDVAYCEVIDQNCNVLIPKSYRQLHQALVEKHVWSDDYEHEIRCAVETHDVIITLSSAIIFDTPYYIALVEQVAK